MILALGFFVNGRLKLTDYREFIRANSLSQEQLLSAKHFLQRDQLFADGIETELLKWYSEFTTRVTNSYEDGNYFDTRHKFVSGVVNDNGIESGANYLVFMTQTVLPRIVETQQMIKNDIRFIEFSAVSLESNGIKNFFFSGSLTLELDMRDARFMEVTSLVLLLLVILLSPVIILLVKNATSTIQVATVSSETALRLNGLYCI